jgi:hypothetical protein
MDLGIAVNPMIPAVFMLLAGCAAVYLASAIVVNQTLGVKFFPNPEPFIKSNQKLIIIQPLNNAQANQRVGKSYILRLYKLYVPPA